ncbi:MAG: extracellular solute-binding protein [Limnochordia bacterium]
MNRVSSRIRVAIVVVLCLVCVSAHAAERVSLLIRNVGMDDLRVALAAFTDRTGIEVDIIEATSWPDVIDKAVVYSAGGIAPDLIYGDNVRLSQLAYGGLLLDLDERVKRSGQLSRMPVPVIAAFRTVFPKEGLYSLPTALSNRAVFFDADAFDDAGLSHPPAEWASHRWNWETYVSDMKRLTHDTDGDGKPDVFGTASFGTYGGVNMAEMFGANLFDPVTNAFDGRDPDFIAAMEKMTGLWTEHGVVGGNFLRRTAASDHTQARRLHELLDMERRGEGFNWRVAASPRGERAISQTSIHGLGMSLHGRQHDTAWELLAYLTLDPQGAILFSRAENRVPVVREAINDFLKRWSADFPDKDVNVFVTAMDHISLFTLTSGIGGDERERILRDIWAQIESGRASVRGAFEAAMPAIEASFVGQR